MLPTRQPAAGVPDASAVVEWRVPFRIKVSLWILALLAAFILVGPLLVPVAPLAGLKPARELAWPGSAWVRVGALDVHVEAWLDGAARTTSDRHLSPPAAAPARAYALLHGFGASTRSWNQVLPWLSEAALAVAHDRPAFGLTDRPLGERWTAETNPYGTAAQVGTTLGVLDALGIDRAVLFGHSAGGTIAVQMALQHPERVAGLVLVAPAVYAGGGAPGWSRAILNTPQMARLGPLIARQFGGEQGEAFLRSSFFDPGKLTPEILAAYRHPLQVEGWDLALWELVKSSRESTVANALANVRVPVLVITGAEDAIVPAEQSQRLAQDLVGVPGGAAYIELAGCGHLPHEECAAAFETAVRGWLAAAAIID
jgi:pimeloyl-ACP methyl ester carboxylesterase